MKVVNTSDDYILRGSYLDSGYEYFIIVLEKIDS